MRSLLSFVLVLPLGLFAQQQTRSPRPVPVVVLTTAPDLRASVDQLEQLRGHGLAVSVVAGEGCFIGSLDAVSIAALRDLPGVLAVVDAPLPEAVVNGLPSAKQVGVRYLNELLNGSFESPGVRAPMDWSAHPEEHALEQPAMRSAPQHQGGGNRTWNPQTLDWTCGNSYNSETLDGVVVASTFFIESNGTIDANLYTWPQADVNSVKSQVIDAWSIWSYTASLYGRTVTAVMDWYEPVGGIPVQGYEPVTRSSGADYLWIDAIMTNAGRTESGAFGKVQAFNHDRRAQLNADRSLSAFIAYNPGAAPSQFTDGKIGYAYLGGPYMQILWRANGWTTSQINRVYGHETGHIFHAFDEYTSSGAGNCSRYFNGRQNSNYQGSTCNGSAGCVMINNAFVGSGATRSWSLCSHTPYHLGWQGALSQPLCTAPVNDSLVTVNPFVLRWNRAGAPASAFGYLKVYERTTDSLVYCGYVGQSDTLAMSLVNGQYRWLITQGNTSTGNGYAGMLSAAALFTVNAPLHAAFSRNPGTLCAGTTVTYTNTSTGAPTSWAWSFPGGVPSTWSGKFPAPVRYDVPGVYSATLTVGDGLTTDPETMVAAATVTGGSAIPFVENFSSGTFPPTGWTAQSGGGVGQGGGGLAWTPLAEPSCAHGTAAMVPAQAYSGFYAGPSLKTPRIDLTQSTLPYLRFKHSYARRSAAAGGSFSITGNNCNYTRYAELYNKADSLLSTNGGVPIASPAWLPSTCEHWRETVLRLDSLKGHIAELTFRFNVPGADQDFHLDDVAVFEGVRLNVRVLLEGPLNTQTGLMNDVLRTQGLIPLVEPYSALGVSWKGEGGGQATTAAVLSVTGPNAIVDWVIVELRDALVPSLVLASRPALVQRDGDVVDTDGLSGVRMPLPQASYFVSVRHRNHLPVCTEAAVAITSSMPTLDLSLPATATYGTAARRTMGAYAALWSGDNVRNNLISYTGSANDRDAILLKVGGTVPTNTVAGYHLEDNNLDGVVKYTGGSNDRDIILNNIGGTVPTNTRAGQLP